MRRTMYFTSPCQLPTRWVKMKSRKVCEYSMLWLEIQYLDNHCHWEVATPFPWTHAKKHKVTREDNIKCRVEGARYVQLATGEIFQLNTFLENKMPWTESSEIPAGYLTAAPYRTEKAVTTDFGMHYWIVSILICTGLCYIQAHTEGLIRSRHFIPWFH